jgi:hypothetical protein
MNDRSEGDLADRPTAPAPATTAPRSPHGRAGRDPRAATGTGIGSDPARITAPAGSDPAGDPGAAPASDADADGEPDGAAVSGPDRHNATETDPSGTSVPPGSGATRSPDDASTA